MNNPTQHVPAFVIAVAVAACGTRAPAVRTGIPAVPAGASARPAILRFVLTDHFREHYMQPFGRVFGAPGCDGTRGVAGNVRAEIHGEEVALSEPASDTSTLFAERVAGGWLFKINYTIYWSEHFTGRLRPLVAAPRLDLGHDSPGRAVLLDRANRGEFWTTDGRTITHVDSLRGHVASVAFRDADHGAAVLRDGSLHETGDGGAAWRRVPLGGDFALRVRGDAGALSVATNRGWFRIDGSLHPIAPPADRPCIETSSPQLRRMGEARDARLDAAPDQITWLRGGGQVAVSGEGLRVTTAAGRTRTEDALEDTCDFAVPWGDDAFVWCGGGLRVRADGTILRVDRSPDVARERDPLRDAMFSDDGMHAAFVRSCAAWSSSRSTPEDGTTDDPPAEDSPTEDPPTDAQNPGPSQDEGLAVCVYDDRAHASRTVPIPVGPDTPRAIRLIAMRGTTLLLQGDTTLPQSLWESSTALPWSFWTLDTATGALARVATPASSGTSWRYRDLRFAGDGQLVGLVERCSDACETALVVGPTEHTLTMHAAPDRASRVAFADARRGLAWGARSDRVWRTVDGGATWERVPLPPYDAWPGATAKVLCGVGGCSVRDSLRIEGWGPLPAPTPSYLEPESTLDLVEPSIGRSLDDDTPPRPPEAPPRMGGASYACSLAAWRRSPWRSARAESAGMAWWGRWTFTRTSAPGATPPQGRHEWWSLDGHGVEQTTNHRDDWAREVGWVGRDTLQQDGEHALVWLRGGRRERVALPMLPEGGLVDLWSGWFGASPTGDGGLAVALRGGMHDRGSGRGDFNAVVRMDARGALSAMRLYDEEADVALVGARGRWGLARIVAGEAVRLQPVDGAPGDEVELPVWRGVVAPCADPTDDAATVEATCNNPSGCVWPTLTRASADVRDERARFELSPRGVCLRAVSAVWRGVAPGARDRRPGEYFLSLAARRGALEGFADDGTRRARVRCVPSNHGG